MVSLPSRTCARQEVLKYCTYCNMITNDVVYYGWELGAATFLFHPFSESLHYDIMSFTRTGIYIYRIDAMQIKYYST